MATGQRPVTTGHRPTGRLPLEGGLGTLPAKKQKEGAKRTFEQELRRHWAPALQKRSEENTSREKGPRGPACEAMACHAMERLALRDASSVALTLAVRPICSHTAAVWRPKAPGWHAAPASAWPWHACPRQGAPSLACLYCSRLASPPPPQLHLFLCIPLPCTKWLDSCGSCCPCRRPRLHCLRTAVARLLAPLHCLMFSSCS